MKNKSLNIALIGYGRMGHTIEKIARQRGHHIVCIIDKDNVADFQSRAFREADVAIEFSTPATAVENILKCIAAGVPVVSGTTGWQSDMPAVKKTVEEEKGALLYGSNFSVGVNIFMALNRYLAGIMNSFENYSPDMTETHHIHKLDHPSGTAVTLADELVERVERVDEWIEPCNSNPAPRQMPLNFIRRGEVAGIHTIEWESEFDTISISHSAKTREGFALGAVLGAEWLPGHTGFFSVGNMMQDITGLKDVFISM